MLPRGYVPEHPSSALPHAASSTCTRHRSGGCGTAMILPTGHAFVVIPAWQEPGPNPPQHRANGSSTTDWHKATAVCFQTHVGIGSMEKQPSRWYSRLRHYFIVSLMAFPFSVQYYVTPLPYRNRRKHWNFYFIMETITSPNAINTIRGVEVTWQLVTAVVPDKSNARAPGYLQNLLQTKSKPWAGVGFIRGKVKWKLLKALLPLRSWTLSSLGSCFGVWLLAAPAPPGRTPLPHRVAEPPRGRQSQPGKPQPYQEVSAVGMPGHPAWEEGNDASTMWQAWAKLPRVPGPRMTALDCSIEPLVPLLQASWRKWRCPKTC